MAKKISVSFNPKSPLAQGAGQSIVKLRKNQAVFAQGDPADAVFYIQKGKVRVSVVSDRGRKQLFQSWGHIEVHKSLLNLVLHEQPHIKK